ncbi:2-keto-4-pentenoate hydratase [Paracandidimonas lactea]|uniref:2-keto-4-pentenoate hydratase n=1 Tax=Paracandidimonas lactea TaxID=2895524 RepID=UPI001F4216A8|nr:fumarylacetoacetate hydrolase family protein [Paracandidimonas lactea]
MTNDHIAQAAQQLLNARAHSAQINALAPACRPNTEADAYAIQDAVIAQIGPIGGWKVGASSPDGEPNCAPLPASGIMKAPVRLSSSDFRLRGIEAEIAFQLKSDLPARDKAYSLDEVLAAVGAVHPVIELIESRYSDRTQVDPYSALADSLSHGGLVVGEGRDTNFTINQLTQHVELLFNDEQVFSAIGGNAAGDVLRLLPWLANHAGKRQGGLRAGQIITTGSCSGVLFAEPGATVNARLKGLGWVEVAFV